ncbi:hypothetical protein H072_7980 [Dactylellina haptotyla CBS 200.50]|uniref:Uncharacterized protein n=1 Tax=Dactylellina haptotyla (strain CBS 200.50) TaxID=1284197 RepID=S8AAU1_DACHA|nr:hypothetical protein H072_7980 [Dactylellina haptotyla CBS 200.50]
MDVTRANFKDQLPEILKLIEESEFIAFDFEYSGLLSEHGRGPFPGKIERGRKPTMEERYQLSKESAERYCIFQMGICCLTWDTKSNRYLGRPFNFYITPAVIPSLHYDRNFSATGDAMAFHSKHGFDFNRLFGQGCTYLSHSEEVLVRDIRRLHEEDLENDVYVDEGEGSMLKAALKQIQAWDAERDGDTAAFLNIIPLETDRVFNAYQRRLLHQLLRNKFPHLIGQSYDKHFQVQPKIEDREVARAKVRDEHFEALLKEQRGVRIIIDKIKELKKPLVGHNCFGDLCYWIRMFDGSLPATLGEFRQLLRKDFGLIIDTKFLAMNMDRKLYGEISSGLQELVNKLGNQNLPRVEVPVGACNYDNGTRDHQAGCDSWNTARALVKMAVRMYNVGSDDPPAPAETTCEVDKRREQIGAALAVRPNRNGWCIMVDLEKTPAIARMPPWTSLFWVVFGGRLRVNGTIEGEFTI